MPSFQSEWSAFVAQTPNLPHDDPERTKSFLSSPAGNALSTGVATVDVRVPGTDGHQIPIRVYTSDAKEGPSGLVIFFHSGGFTGGSLDTEDVSCRYMALNGHVTAISVEYRLSPEYVYPIPIDDGWIAVQHIISNISSFVPNNTEPTPLVLCGTSSGGHLAAILSQRLPRWLRAAENASFATKVSFNGVLLRAPVTVRGTGPEFIPPKFRQLHRSWMDDYHGAESDRLSMTRNHDSLGVPVAERNSPDAYPLWGTLEGLPKTYIQICEMDILRDDATCYARALLDAGVEVRETFYKGLPHIFWVYGQHLSVSKVAQDNCVDGLRWLLGTTE